MSLSPRLGGGDGAQLAVVDDDQPGAVAADREPVEVARRVRSCLALVMSKCSRVGRPEVSSGLAKVSPSAPEIGQRSQTSPPPLTGCSAEYLEAVTGNGVTRLCQPLDLDQSPCRPRRPRSSAGSRPPAAGRPSGEQREGGGRRGGQRHEIRAAAQREGEVAGVHVVHRVEAAPGEEGEIAAVAGEDRVLVLEAAVGDVDDRAAVGPSFAPS